MVACQYAAEDFEGAIASGEKLLQLESEPVARDALYQRMGVAAMSLEQYDKAVDYLTKSMESGEGLVGNHYYRGVCYVQLLDYESVLSDMEMTLTSGDEQSLKDAATDILWQLAQYYENQKALAPAQIEAQSISE